MTSVRAAAVAALLLAASVSPFATGVAGATPVGPQPQNAGGCNVNVCIQVDSLNGSGPDITTVVVYSNYGIVIPIGDVIQVDYGVTAAAAKQNSPLAAYPVTEANTTGRSFGIFRTLKIGPPGMHVG